MERVLTIVAELLSRIPNNITVGIQILVIVIVTMIARRCGVPDLLPLLSYPPPI